LIEAARMADGFAERQAEKARYHAEAWQAGSRYAELGEEIKEVRRELIRLIHEFKKSPERAAPGSAIRAAIYTRIEELLNAIADARQQRADIVDLRAWPRDLVDAFNDGAGSAIIS
jgi:predicted nuclease with TOPRIM domain